MIGMGERLPKLLATLGLAALAALNWYVVTMPIDVSPAALSAGEETSPALPDGETQPLPQPAQEISFPQTLARPLFRPDRRPRDTTKPEATASLRAASLRPQAPPPSLELVGIIKESGGAGRALIRWGDEPTGSWVQVGHMLEGWRLSRIDARGIVLEADGRQVQLSLNQAKQ